MINLRDLYWIVSIWDELGWFRTEMPCYSVYSNFFLFFTNIPLILTFCNCLFAFLQMDETCFSDEMTELLFISKSYLFSFFITAHNHCLELLWIYYHIIIDKAVNERLYWTKNKSFLNAVNYFCKKLYHKMFDLVLNPLLHRCSTE